MKSLVLCLLLIPLTALAEKDICTVQLPGDYPEELLISEDQYTQATALEAVLYLETTLPEFIESSENIEELRGNEMYFLSLPNHTKLLKGFILKQDYELAKLDYDLAIATDAPDAEDRQTMLWAAKKAFCDFMAQVPTYAD